MDQTKIWNHFQNESARDIFAGALPRYRYLASKIHRGRAVLNIGVGRGGLESLLFERGIAVHALDPSEQSIKNLQNTLPIKDQARVGYSQNIPFEAEAFDYVIMSEVLEHLSLDVLEQTVVEIKRVLRFGGKFIGTVPANEVIEAQMVACPKCGDVFHQWGHMQSFQPDSLRDLLQKAGLNRVKIEYRSFPDWQRPGIFNFIKSLMRYALGRMGESMAMPSLYFEARKV